MTEVASNAFEDYFKIITKEQMNCVDTSKLSSNEGSVSREAKILGIFEGVYFKSLYDLFIL